MASNSAAATKYKDAYFTSLEDAKWCIKQLENHFDLDGKMALEPACGSGVFLRASKKSGLVWVTNELYPEFAQGYEADFTLDFAKDDISEMGWFDFVITNPPFGYSSGLARKFVKRALGISDVVAMLLPKGLRRGTVIDAHIPDDVKIVFDKNIPNGQFDLPDGTTREVGCAFIIYQRIEGYSRGKLLDYEPKGYKAESKGFLKSSPIEDFWPDWATHGICTWGSAGLFFDRTRVKSFAECVFFRLTDEQAEIVASIDWGVLIERTRVSVPRIRPAEVYTEINRALANG